MLFGRSVEQQLTVVSGGVVHQGKSHGAHGTCGRADQSAGGCFAGSVRRTAGDGTRGQVLAILIQVQGFFVDGDVLVGSGDEGAVVDIDGDGGGAFIAVGITHGVGEYVGGTRRADAVRIAVVNGVAVGVQGQVAVGAVDLGVKAANR